MATDIAFAVGILGLLGRRVPVSLRIFVLALAIVDDIGAIVIIAAFYSEGIDVLALAGALSLGGLIVGLRNLGVRAMPVYVVVGSAMWAATLSSGIHPTIAGVVLGLLTPVVPFQPPAGVSSEARRVADETVDDPHPPDADAPQWRYLAALSREAAPPSARLQGVLHAWTSFLILPLFALANAGVNVSGALRDGLGSVTTGVALGLVVGKSLGVLGAAALGSAIGVARRPPGISWLQLAGVSAVAGVGFTVALFISDLAYPSSGLLGQAKLGVFAGSLAAALLGVALLRTAHPRTSGQRTGGPV